jgi:hypothetical protein
MVIQRQAAVPCRQPMEKPPMSLVRDAANLVVLIVVAVGLAWLAQQLYYVALNLWGAS